MGEGLPELRGRKLPRGFYLRPTLRVARELLGKVLVRKLRGRRLAGIISEVEAYLGARDPASHAFRGQTPRNSVMFGPGGHLYVYFTYGMHHCCNVVTGTAGRGGTVLIRGILPIAGEETMRRLRKLPAGGGKVGPGYASSLTDGPGKICQAMSISLKDNGTDLTGNTIYIIDRPTAVPPRIVSSKRIGISQAKEKLWRFSIAETSRRTGGRTALSARRKRT